MGPSDWWLMFALAASTWMPTWCAAIAWILFGVYLLNEYLRGN